MMVNGKKLTKSEEELYFKLVNQNPDFRAKVEFLAGGGSFRNGGVKKIKGKYVNVD